MSVSLDLFAVFARVGECGSFTRAARELGMSKATVSKQVAALERELGVVLVARTTRKAALTEAGERVLRRAQRMVEEGDAAKREASEARDTPRGRLKVSAPLSFGMRYLAPIMGDFLTAYPELTVDLALEDRAVDLISEGFDAALRIRALEDSTLVARRLEQIEVFSLAAPAYLAGRTPPQRPEDLSHHACLHYTNLASATAWRFEAADGTKVTAQVQGPFCSNNGDLLLEMAKAGHGIALLPDFLCWQAVSQGSLRTLLPGWRAPVLALHLLTPPGRGLPRKLRAFSDLMHDHFAAGRAPWRQGASKRPD
jgi:molybdate transport repressor ModE-like protein